LGLSLGPLGSLRKRLLHRLQRLLRRFILQLVELI